MKERPILFKGEMVRAILAGRKTQTRRIVKDTGFYAIDANIHGPETAARELKNLATQCPHGVPGDRLWVQESYHVVGHGAGGPSLTVKYLADDAIRTVDVSPETYLKFRARKTDGALGGRFMYRDISRLLLELTAVRVERLNDISEEDAKAEGCDPIDVRNVMQDERDLLDLPAAHADTPHRNGYALLWESINGAGSWAANPYVWVESFRVL